MGWAYCTKTLYNMGGKVETFGPVSETFREVVGMNMIPCDVRYVKYRNFAMECNGHAW